MGQSNFAGLARRQADRTVAHQAYASGASPLGPGQISSTLMWNSVYGADGPKAVLARLAILYPHGIQSSVNVTPLPFLQKSSTVSRYSLRTTFSVCRHFDHQCDELLSFNLSSM